MLRLSVIIPTLNEEVHVERAIESAWKCGASEVIVVDGGSSDNTRSIAQRQAANVLATPRGRALQQNAGAAAACGDYLLFLHADSYLDEDCGGQLRRALTRDGFVAGAFRQRIEADGFRFRLLESGNAARARWLHMPYGDQGISVRADVFQRLDGFPEVPLLEDLLLMRRLRTVGKPVLLPGPLYVNPRRWQQRGVVRQTLENWSLVAAWRLGVAPATLARFYPPHSADEKGGGVATSRNGRRSR